MKKLLNYLIAVQKATEDPNKYKVQMRARHADVEFEVDQILIESEDGDCLYPPSTLESVQSLFTPNCWIMFYGDTVDWKIKAQEMSEVLLQVKRGPSVCCNCYSEENKTWHAFILKVQRLAYQSIAVNELTKKHL